MKVQHVFCGTIAALLVLAGGCTMYDQGQTTSHGFTSTGIPALGHLVGGGSKIEYAVPTDGNVYVVDQVSKRILITKSVKQGQVFTFDPASNEEFSNLGISSSATIALYFVPSVATVPLPVSPQWQ